MNKEERKEYNRQYNLKNKCSHNKRKSRCIDCGGSEICQHNRQKSRCIDCGGSSFCEHNRQKSQCKDCGGSSFCEHNRQNHIVRNAVVLQYVSIIE